MDLIKYNKSTGNREMQTATFEDMIAFYLVRPVCGINAVHEGAIVIPGSNGRDGQIGTMQLEIYPAPKTGRWHWKILSHETNAFMEDSSNGFESAAEAMESALETEDGMLCFASWLDAKRLVEMARSVQEHRERKAMRGA
jgi:hypothetical protein